MSAGEGQTAGMRSSEESTNLEGDRVKSLVFQLKTESGILDRIVHKGKNQHRRCPYFKTLLKVRRDVNLLNSAGLGEILNALFPIIEGRKPAQKAYLPLRLKKKQPSGNHNYQERLLGVARLLSQMSEPILKAAIQISFLLAKSFFIGFSLTILALLARLRVLVQEILLEVVSIFNKVSSISQKKHSVKLNQNGFEAFREYYPYPSNGDVITLECLWEKDKFVLIERTHKSNAKEQDEHQGTLPSETSIQYETIDLLKEGQQCTKHEFSSEEIQNNFPLKESCTVDVGLDINSSSSSSQLATLGANKADVKDKKHLVKQGNLFSGSERSVGPVAYSKSLETKSRKRNVAFISVGNSKASETRDSTRPSKKVKMEELLARNSTRDDDPFTNIIFSGSTESTIF